VDFDEEHRGACNAQTERDLEELTAHYAVHLHAFSKERLHDRLDSSLAPLVGDPEQPAVVLPIAEDPTEDVEKLQNWLMLLGQSLGVERGALFLRDKEYGDYRLRSELPGWDRLPEDCRYKPGDGRTGWVALNKKPLRINDCSNLREMARIKPRLTQSTHPPCWDRDSERLAYLGVPVLVGGDVLGVLRFVCRSPRAPGERRQWTGKEHFTALDQQLAEAAAARLGGWLYKRLELDRIIALRRLAHEILKARSREELCRTIHDVLERGIGRCRVVLRLADRRSRDGGRPERALDRVFVSDGSHDSWPAFRTQQEEVAIQVWKEGRRYVSQDVSEDPNLGWPRELAGSLVISPLKADRNTCGTLAVHRAHPHALLQSDLDFVEKVTELAGLAFKRLGEVEEHRIQENLLWAVLEHFRQHLGAEDGRAGWYLLRKITKVVKDGLGASARYVWTGDEEAGRLTTFQAEVRPVAWSADVPRPGPGPGPTAGRVVVVTEPETDRRLLSLQKALHPRDRAGYADRQRAAIVLPPAEHLNLYQPSVLLFVVDPPHRLSHVRVERVFRMLSETLFRLWPRS
jgi:GAF domain-containing protein